GAPAAPFVEHVDGQRRQAVLAGRIARRSAPDQQDAADDRHRVMADGPDAEPVREDRLLDGGEDVRPAAGGSRQLRAIDLDGGRRHDTTAVCEPATASSGRPRGTTLSVTRGAVAT